MESLARIRNAGHAIGVAARFHFFPAQLGVTYHQISRHLRTWLPDCKIYPRADYAWYMEKLGSCDLVLVPFPFGGTNSTVDALWLGLPVITVLGEQPHSRFDALLLRRVGLGRLVARDVNEFEDMALDMLDMQERAAVFDHLAAQDLDRELFSEPAVGAGEIYGRAFSHLFRHHEQIQRSGSRIIKWEDYDE